MPDVFDRLDLIWLTIPARLLEVGCGRALGSRLADTPYEQGELTAADYPTLIEPGRSYPTIGVPAVLAVHVFPEGHRRAAATRGFVQALFEKASALGRPGAGYNKNWCGVDLAAPVRTWRRFDAAQQWLDRDGRRSISISCSARQPFCASDGEIVGAFNDWLRGRGRSATVSKAETARLFEQFKQENCG